MQMFPFPGKGTYWNCLEFKKQNHTHTKRKNTHKKKACQICWEIEKLVKRYQEKPLLSSSGQPCQSGTTGNCCAQVSSCRRSSCNALSRLLCALPAALTARFQRGLDKRTRAPYKARSGWQSSACTTVSNISMVRPARL